MAVSMKMVVIEAHSLRHSFQEELEIPNLIGSLLTLEVLALFIFCISLLSTVQPQRACLQASPFSVHADLRFLI